MAKSRFNGLQVGSRETFQKASIGLGCYTLWLSNTRLSRVSALGSHCGRRQRSEGHWRGAAWEASSMERRTEGRGVKAPLQVTPLFFRSRHPCILSSLNRTRVSLSHVGRQIDVFEKARILSIVYCLYPSRHIGDPDR